MMNRSWWCGLVVGALSLVGCGGSKSCEELCNLNSGCEGVLVDDTPCKEQCEALEVELKETGCEAQQEAFDACLSELESVCTASSDCNDEGLALFDCRDDYCQANPNAALCGDGT